MAQWERPALLKPVRGEGLRGRYPDKAKERRFHQGQGGIASLS